MMSTSRHCRFHNKNTSNVCAICVDILPFCCVDLAVFYIYETQYGSTTPFFFGIYIYIGFVFLVCYVCVWIFHRQRRIENIDYRRLKYIPEILVSVMWDIVVRQPQHQRPARTLRTRNETASKHKCCLCIFSLFFPRVNMYSYQIICDASKPNTFEKGANGMAHPKQQSNHQVMFISIHIYIYTSVVSYQCAVWQIIFLHECLSSLGFCLHDAMYFGKFELKCGLAYFD